MTTTDGIDTPPPPDDDGGVRYRLAVTRPDGTTENIDVGLRPIALGRADGADIQLDEARVSRHHCVLIGTPGRLVVQDLGSANGTYVNDGRVEQASLVAGDEVRVGSTVLRVEMAGVDDGEGPSPRSRRRAAISTSTEMPRTSSWTPADGVSMARLANLLENTGTPLLAADAVLELLLEALPFENAAVLVADSLMSDGFRILASSRRGAAPAEALAPAFEFAQKAVDTDQPYFGVDADPAEATDSSSNFNLTRMRAIFCAPLRRGSVHQGVLYGETARGHADVDQGMIPTFVGVAELASQAISKAEGEAADRADRARLETLGRSLEDQLKRFAARSAEQSMELALRTAELGQVRRARQALTQGLLAETGALAQQVGARVARLVQSDHGVDTTAAEGIAVDVRRFTSLVECLTTAVGLEDGEVHLSMRASSVAEMVRHGLARLEASARAHDVTVTVADLPRRVTAVVDGAVMAHVLDVILATALRAAGQRGTLDVHVEEEGDRIDLAVTSAGAEPPEGERARLLEAWRNGGEGASGVPGISDQFCRRALEAQGGRVSLEGDVTTLRWRVSMPARGTDNTEDITVA